MFTGLRIYSENLLEPSTYNLTSPVSGRHLRFLVPSVLTWLLLPGVEAVNRLSLLLLRAASASPRLRVLAPPRRIACSLVWFRPVPGWGAGFGNRLPRARGGVKRARVIVIDSVIAVGHSPGEI